MTNEDTLRLIAIETAEKRREHWFKKAALLSLGSGGQPYAELVETVALDMARSVAAALDEALPSEGRSEPEEDESEDEDEDEPRWKPFSNLDREPTRREAALYMKIWDKEP